ncbi:MAG TPA: SRPBCC domain-containing protein [Acidimicrobiales bacterium]|nr:SRPBCC domain-containing protein [Acidimicrobiales bacterium]
MTYDFEVSDRMPVPPDVVYAAWLSSIGHSAMTGGTAHVDAREGGDFDAWDGYIHGVTLTLEPFARIVQSWRTQNFTDEQPDSQIEVLFEGDEAGTLVRVLHSNVPADQLGYEQGGWQKSYFDPMKAYFAAE